MAKSGNLIPRVINRSQIKRTRAGAILPQSDGGVRDFRSSESNQCKISKIKLSNSMIAVTPAMESTNASFASWCNSIRDAFQAKHDHIPDQHDGHHSRDGEP